MIVGDYDMLEERGDCFNFLKIFYCYERSIRLIWNNKNEWF